MFPLLKFGKTNKEEHNMASLKCKDLGMNCGFEVKDQDESELMDIVALHAKKTHNLTPNPELMDKIKKAIKR
jgi:predicted small metal-binding protein